jgi:hypothetical protein
MTEIVHIHNVWLICTITDYGDLNIQVQIPVGQKGNPGFVIHNGKVVKGKIPWKSLEQQPHIGWYKEADYKKSEFGYKRLDFIDHKTGTRYYCTKGNDCTYCRSAPHAQSKDECIYVEVEEKIHNRIAEKRDGDLAKCEGCGVTLISPYDGQPYWCQECSMERDE